MLKASEPPAVDHGIDCRVGQHQDELNVANPVYEQTITAGTQIDYVNADAGGEITGNKQRQHEHQRLGHFLLVLERLLQSETFFVAFVLVVPLFHLRLHALKDPSIRERHHDERSQHGGVAEDETINVVTDGEVDAAQRDGENPDADRRHENTAKADGSSVPHRSSYGQVAVHS